MRELNLITEKDGIVEVDKRLKCSQNSYAAVKWEHTMPNSPVLFAVMESSGNVLLITESFACKHLNKYAAGKQEHPELVIASGKSKFTIDMVGDQIENSKKAGVAINMAEQTEQSRNYKVFSALTDGQKIFFRWDGSYPAKVRISILFMCHL